VGALASLNRLALVGSLGGLLAPACSLGQGTGSVAGALDVPDCWSGCFDLHPDFFAAISTNSTALEIRIQNGIDYETFSDGLLIIVDDLGEVRGDPLPRGQTRAGLLGQPLVVALPVGVTPPGVPIKPVANPSLVHATLYLGRTCRTQNVALQAMACTLPNDGQTLVCGEASVGAEPDASAGVGDAGAPADVTSSTITFHSLFDGDINESNAAQRLTDADFDFYLADPREVSAGGLGPPPPCRSHLQGRFHFYFQRGRPAQPFP
jgi:hypothetical protein